MHITLTTTQCWYLSIFLPLRFYVKSILMKLQCQKQQFYPFFKPLKFQLLQKYALWNMLNQRSISKKNINLLIAVICGKTRSHFSYAGKKSWNQLFSKCCFHEIFAKKVWKLPQFLQVPVSCKFLDSKFTYIDFTENSSYWKSFKFPHCAQAFSLLSSEVDGIDVIDAKASDQIILDVVLAKYSEQFSWKV